MNLQKSKILNRFSASLLASAIAVSAFAISPNTSNILSFSAASAEAVQVDAPRAPSFADVVEAVSPAVVSVRVEQMMSPASSDDDEFRFDRRRGQNGHDIPEFFKDNPEFFKRFFGERGRGDQERRGQRRFGSSQGSGFFITEDGFLVTNNHVVENGEKFTIVLDDKTELTAKLIGADERSDLAVLKVDDPRKFTYVDFAVEEPRIGDWVVAVGNPFGLGGTVTAGIVSARGREIGASRYDDFIQIDAAVNKGNSGGPAFDLSGKVIGVNTAIFSPSGGNVGIAFAIPASTSREIVDELMSKGSVVRGWLGVQIQPVTDDIAEALALESASGAMVTEPQADSPATKAGIRSGDIITKVDGRLIKGPKALARIIGEYNPDTKTVLTIIRNGEEQEVSVTLGTLGNVAAVEGAPEKETVEPSANKLGMALTEAPEGDGVLVVEVAPESSADSKGIQSGDIVAAVNGEEVKTADDVSKIIDEAEKAGRKSTLLQIKRDGATQFIAVPFDRS
jgi:serine protease Do